MDCANLIAGSYLGLDTVNVSGSTKMRTMKILDTLLRHHRGCLYSEPLHPDLFFLHHPQQLETQVQLPHPRSSSSILKPKTQDFLQFHSKRNSNGSTQKGIGTKGKATRSENVPSDSS